MPRTLPKFCYPPVTPAKKAPQQWGLWAIVLGLDLRRHSVSLSFNAL